MKQLRFALLLLLQGLSANAFAQAEYIAEIDTTSGLVSKIGNTPIPGITWVYPNVRTYDEVNGEFIFSGFTNLPASLYFIDVATGAPVTSPIFPASGGPSAVREPQYDNSEAKLYALHWDTSAQAFFLSTIDRNTGLHTHVGNIPITSLNGTGQGTTTFDEHRHRYIHLAGKQLVSIDAISGALLTDQMLNIPQLSNIISICYDQANDTLVGLRQVSGTPQHYVACYIDLATGTVTDIGTGTTMGKGNGTGAIDTTANRYLYLYSDALDFFIGGLDLSTGSLVFHHQLTLDSGENIHSIIYDNTRQKLFAVHWNYDREPTDIPYTIQNIGLRIYPVPAREKVYVRLAKQYTSVAIYNMTGRIQRLINSTNMDELAIDVSGLETGMYIIECTGKDGSKKGKVMVE